MKRLMSVACCLVVLLGGVAAALATCEKMSFMSDDHRHSSVAHAAQDQNSDASHDHSEKSVVHCPSVDQFVSAAVFSSRPDRGPVRVVSPFVSNPAFRIGRGDISPLSRSPSAYAVTNGVPSQLFHSVLRI